MAKKYKPDDKNKIIKVLRKEFEEVLKLKDEKGKIIGPIPGIDTKTLNSIKSDIIDYLKTLDIDALKKLKSDNFYHIFDEIIMKNLSHKISYTVLDKIADYYTAFANSKLPKDDQIDIKDKDTPVEEKKHEEEIPSTNKDKAEFLKKLSDYIFLHEIEKEKDGKKVIETTIDSTYWKIGINWDVLKDTLNKCLDHLKDKKDILKEIEALRKIILENAVNPFLKNNKGKLLSEDEKVKSSVYQEVNKKFNEFFELRIKEAAAISFATEYCKGLFKKGGKTIKEYEEPEEKGLLQDFENALIKYLLTKDFDFKKTKFDDELSKGIKELHEKIFKSSIKVDEVDKITTIPAGDYHPYEEYYNAGCHKFGDFKIGANFDITPRADLEKSSSYYSFDAKNKDDVNERVCFESGARIANRNKSQYWHVISQSMKKSDNNTLAANTIADAKLVRSDGSKLDKDHTDLGILMLIRDAVIKQKKTEFDFELTDRVSSATIDRIIKMVEYYNLEYRNLPVHGDTPLDEIHVNIDLLKERMAEKKKEEDVLSKAKMAKKVRDEGGKSDNYGNKDSKSAVKFMYHDKTNKDVIWFDDGSSDYYNRRDEANENRLKKLYKVENTTYNTDFSTASTLLGKAKTVVNKYKSKNSSYAYIDKDGYHLVQTKDNIPLFDISRNDWDNLLDLEKGKTLSSSMEFTTESKKIISAKLSDKFNKEQIEQLIGQALSEYKSIKEKIAKEDDDIKASEEAILDVKKKEAADELAAKTASSKTK